MNVEKVHNKIRYTLSNYDLQVGDEVFPVAWGRCLDDGGWILHNFDYRDFMSGFPDEPHIILDLHHSDYKPYEVRTNKGFSPKESYYKITKKEKQIEEGPEAKFKTYKWVEI